MIFTVLSIFLVMIKRPLHHQPEGFCLVSFRLRASNVFDTRSRAARATHAKGTTTIITRQEIQRQRNSKQVSETEHDSEHAPKRHRRSAKLYNMYIYIYREREIVFIYIGIYVYIYISFEDVCRASIWATSIQTALHPSVDPSIRRSASVSPHLLGPFRLRLTRAGLF